MKTLPHRFITTLNRFQITSHFHITIPIQIPFLNIWNTGSITSLLKRISYIGYIDYTFRNVELKGNLLSKIEERKQELTKIGLVINELRDDKKWIDWLNVFDEE